MAMVFIYGIPMYISFLTIKHSRKVWKGGNKIGGAAVALLGLAVFGVFLLSRFVE